MEKLNYVCPICLDIILDPIILEDGIIYDRKCYNILFENSHIINSPITRKCITGNIIEIKQFKNIVLDIIQYTNILDEYIFNLTYKTIKEHNLIKILKSCNKYKKEFQLIDFIEENNYNECYNLLTNNKLKLDFSEIDDYDNNILTFACISNNTDIIKLLLKNNNVDLNYTNKHNNNALIISCMNSNEEIAMILLNKNINYLKININNDNALLWSCYNNLKNVAFYLLSKNDIDINHVNNNNRNCLILATVNNNEKIILKILENNNINYNFYDNDKESPLMILLQNNNKKISRLLLNKPNIDVKLINNAGISILDYASMLRDDEMEILIRKLL